MNPSTAILLATMAASAAAGAADTPDRASPVDANAACMDRTVDSSAGNCVVKDDGTPRRTYPPKSAPPVAAPRTGAAAPAPAVRGAGSK